MSGSCIIVIYELKSSEFDRCKPLVHENAHLEVQAVVEGNNPGRIFVDDPAEPHSGLIWQGNLDGFIFIGEPNHETFNQEINEFMDQVIIPEAKKLGLEWFEGLGHHKNWNQTIEKIFSGRKLDSSNQHVFTLSKEQYRRNNEPEISAEYTVKKLTRDMLASSTYQNQEQWANVILNYWTSLDDFFAKGIAYCAVHREQIVSLCYSGFVAGQRHGIGIETLKEHRGQKLAQKIAHVYVQDCLAHHLIPYWDCMEVNVPSNAVAKNLGFTLDFTYQVYEFPF